jgi:sortase (surface protein transpeptidase)
MAVATLTTIVMEAPPSSSPPARESKVDNNQLTAAQLSDLHRFGKPISTVKPEIGERVITLRPATGPITPYRLRIPAIDIDTLIEPVGVTAGGLMDVPGNVWDAGWLKTTVRPGAIGQAVIDGHLDSVGGSAAFAGLHRLKPGDRIYVSDSSGNEATFTVTALKLEPLDGFNTLRVFGPAQGRFLNLITCAGHYDPNRRTYDHRLVVFTQLM